MPETAGVLAMLKSPKASTRYDACEELRVMQAISEEAEAALRAMMADPDTSVVDAARRALRSHSDPPAPSTLPAPAPAPLAPIRRSGWELSALAILGLAATLASAFIVHVAIPLATAPSAREDLVGTAGYALSWLVVPFQAGHVYLPLRLTGLLYLVAPCCALLLRGRPNPRNAVIAVGFISGVLYLATVYTIGFFLTS